MRIIDLIRNFYINNIDADRDCYSVGDFCFERIKLGMKQDEEYIFRYIFDTGSIYSIGLGCNKITGYILLIKSIDPIVLDIQEILNEDDSYLVLKYEKILLEEIVS